MSPLLRKEIRLILPFWGIAIALAVMPVFSASTQDWHVSDLCFWLFAFGLTLMGLAPFGQECAWGTFSIMLAQPLERRRIWKTKFLLLLGAGAIVFLLFVLSVYVQLAASVNWQVQRFIANHQMEAARAVQLHWHSETFAPAIIKALVLLFVALAGGLWTTLLFRQTGAALWFAILIPGVLVVVVEGVFHSSSSFAHDIAVNSILILYSIGGFVWAWRMLARVQDSQWLGETIAMFSLKSSRAEVASNLPRRKGVFRALIGKEFQSHQISLLIAFGLLVLHVCTLVFRGVYVLRANSELRFIVEAVPFLWLLVPWLMGCVAIAEERKLGTMESQLCLPVRRRFQFEIKFAIVLLLGTFLGGCMPCILEVVADGMGVSSEIVPLLTSTGGRTYFATIIEMQIAACLIGIVSIFASSLTRNTLHALGAAVVFGMAWVYLFSFVQTHSGLGFGYSLWKGPLILLVGGVLSTLATIALSFSNFKRLHAGGRVWLRNVAILFCTLVVGGVATAVVYQRPWELMMAVELQHGEPVLNGAVRPKLVMPGGRICALLPDGRIWIPTDYQMQEVNQAQEPWNDGNEWNGIAFVPHSGTFVGSNWVALAASNEGRDVAAIRSDGTLWSLLSFAGTTNFPRRQSDWLSLSPNPRQIGTNSNWKTVVSLGFSFMAVQSNGTLWGWTDHSGTRFRNDATRIENDSDWETVFSQIWGPVLIKRDGSVWTSPAEGAFVGSRFIRTSLKGSEWLDASGANNYFLFIKRDGSLGEAGMSGYRAFGLNRWWEDDTRQLIRIGKDSDWTAISGFPMDLVAVKGGRLLKNGEVPFAQSIGRLSGYSDWLTVYGSHDRTVALAADGTLSMWFGMPDSRARLEWLARSRRPFMALNILTSSKN